MRPHPYIKHIVTFLHVHVGGNYVPIGTGFMLIVVEDNSVFHYLITCKHVVKPHLDNGLTIYSRLNRTDVLDVGYLPLSSSDWEYSDNPAVDIVVLPIINQVSHPEPLGAGALDADLTLLSKRHLESGYIISEGEEVMFIGLFAQYTGKNRNVPVIRFGHVALITDELTQGEYGLAEHIFVECQAHPGNSGSPLFVYIPYKGKEKRLVIYGVITAFIPDKQKIYLGSNKIEFYTHLGISTATPIHWVREIIYGKTLTKKRQDKLGAGHLGNTPKPAGLLVANDETSDMV